MNSGRYLAVAFLVVLAGCSSAAGPTTTSTTATPTTTATTTTAATTTEQPDTVALKAETATEEDARKLKAQLSEAAPVDVRPVAGDLSVYWRVNTTNPPVLNESELIADMNQTESRFAFLIAYYVSMVGNDTINGSMTLTATTGEHRVAVWHINEQWVEDLNEDKMTTAEFYGRIEQSRVNLSGKPDE